MNAKSLNTALMLGYHECNIKQIESTYIPFCRAGLAFDWQELSFSKLDKLRNDATNRRTVTLKRHMSVTIE